MRNRRKRLSCSNEEVRSLVDRLPRLIRGTFPKLANLINDEDELMSAVSVTVARAVIGWRRNGPAQLETFVLHCVRRTLIREVGKVLRRRATEWALEDHDCPINSYQTADYHETVSHYLRGVVGRPRRMILQRLSGYTYEQIAIQERMRKSTVIRMVKNALRPIQRRMERTDVAG